MKLLKILLLLIILLINSIFISAVPWHNCCDVSVDEDKLHELYDNNIKKNFCYRDEPLNKCLTRYQVDVNKGEEPSYTLFKKIIVDDVVKKCKNETQIFKERYNSLCDDDDLLFLFCKDIRKEYKGPLYSKDDWENPFSAHYDYLKRQKYTFSKTNFPSIEKVDNPFNIKFSVDNSRFKYLDFHGLNSFKKRYLIAYNEAFAICHNVDFIKELKCIDQNINLSSSDKKLYQFYSNENFIGQDYVKALEVCEEDLGWQNDAGIVKFPGQKEVLCSYDELVDGCCPGYVKDKKLNICCPEGYVGFSDHDGVTSCILKGENEQFQVNISLSKNLLKLNGTDFIIATLKYKRGGKVYGNKKIFQALRVDSGYSMIKFRTQRLSSKTDKNGILKVKISPLNIRRPLGINLSEINISVFTFDDRSHTAYFHLKRVPIKITGVEILSNKKIWQNMPVKLRVSVNDILNQDKIYQFESSSRFIVNGKKDDYVAYLRTKKDSVDFIWFAPQISKKVKIDYVKRAVHGLKDITLMATEDVMGSKLDKYVNSNAVISERFQGINNGYSNLNLLVKTKMQADSGIQLGRDAVNEQTFSTYKYLQKEINSFLWLEGTVGILGDPAKPLVTVLKGGLIGVNEWYNIVNDMEKVANSKEITLLIPIKVSVEGRDSNSTYIKNVEVSGYNLILS